MDVSAPALGQILIKSLQYQMDIHVKLARVPLSMTRL